MDIFPKLQFQGDSSPLPPGVRGVSLRERFGKPWFSELKKDVSEDCGFFFVIISSE
jgi:hypothetical protein